jgi:hypothetical protein
MPMNAVACSCGERLATHTEEELFTFIHAHAVRMHRPSAVDPRSLPPPEIEVQSVRRPAIEPATADQTW